MNLKENYIWKKDDTHEFAYEEYVRGISIEYFQKAYDLGKNVIGIIQKGISWLNKNYEGFNNNWKEIYEGIYNDFDNKFNTYGKGNILSKLRELKTEKPGIHFNDDNSYENIIIRNVNFLKRIKYLTQEKISEESTKNIGNGNNYAYFYLREGTGEINGHYFSGDYSALAIYSSSNDKIIINPLKNPLTYYYITDNLKRVQTEIDLNKGGKFIFNKDFPFQFYTAIDGVNDDITFNIQFNKLERTSSSNNEEINFEIEAYVFDEITIKDFANNNINENYYPYDPICKGYYDIGFRIGTIIVFKEEIEKHIKTSFQNHLYIVVKKSDSIDSYLVFEKVEGQFLFVSKDLSSIPENFYIFNNLKPGIKNYHLYKLEMEPSLGKNIRIEFSSSGNELDCKILENKKYDSISEEIYSDFSYEIERTKGMGKEYIDVYQ